MLLSIIIPAFNCEKTISRAIKSTGVYYDSNNIEVIVVDNNSTDNTAFIVKAIAHKNRNVIYVKSSQGVSNARNKGIKLANAPWIAFLDADDIILDERKIVNFLKKSNSDLLIFNYRVNRSKINLFSMTENKDNLNSIIYEMLENPTKYLTVWAKIYNAALLKRKKIKFNPTLVYSEDSEFLIRYLLVCKHINFINFYIYNYYLSNNSTVRKYNPKIIQEYEKAIEQIKIDLNQYPKFKKPYSIFVLMQFNLMMIHGVFANLNNNNQIYQLREISQKKYIREALDDISLRDIMIPRLIPLVFCKYHFFKLAAIIYKLRVMQNSRRLKS